jgi:hypothetical protein
MSTYRLGLTHQQDRDLEEYEKMIGALPDTLVGEQYPVVETRAHVIKSLGQPLICEHGVMIEHTGLSTVDGGFGDRSVVLARRRKRPKDEVTHDMFSQRLWPRLSRCIPRLEDRWLIYEAMDGWLPPLRLEYEDTSVRYGDPPTVIEMHRHKIARIREGDDGKITTWVRKLLAAQLYPDPDSIDVFLRCKEVDRIKDDRAHPGETWKVDGQDRSQVLGCGTGTLKWMNELRKARGLREVSMDAFRPNIVIDCHAGAEDLFAAATIGGLDAISLSAEWMSDRCDMVNVVPKIGKKPDKSVFEWLQTYRPQWPEEKPNKQATFGMNCTLSEKDVGKVIAPKMMLTVTAEKQ